MKELPMQKFDGNQPEINRKGLKAARIAFQNGISDLLHEHTDHVDKQPAYGGGDHLELELRTPPTDEGSVRFNIDRVTSGDETNQIGIIRVSSILPEGQLSPKQHAYKTDEEGVVRRTDINIGVVPGDNIETQTAYKVNPITGAVMGADFIDRYSAMDVIYEYASRQQAVIDKDRKDGLNDQPVTHHEVRGLIEAAKQGKPRSILGSTLRNLVSERLAEPDTRPTQAENMLAGEELYNLINDTLKTHVDDVVAEEVRTWRETKQISETDTWTTEVRSAGLKGENQITTELQNTEGKLVTTERIIFELEGPYAIGRYHMFGAINEDGSEDDIQVRAPLGVQDIRKVRSYLKERRP